MRAYVDCARDRPRLGGDTWRAAILVVAGVAVAAALAGWPAGAYASGDARGSADGASRVTAEMYCDE